MKRTIFNWIRQHGVSVAVFVLTIGIVLGSLPSVMGNTRDEQLRMAEDTLRRAVVTCYALEGRYPPDVAYLRDHYGLQLNDTVYTIHYEIFAENIMPEITVLER